MLKLMRSERILYEIEMALRGKHPDPDATLADRTDWCVIEITRLREAAGELDEIDARSAERVVVLD